MANIIKMPRLSDTMTEGLIVEWKKRVGDKISKGDVLAEIQTDKATMELESFHSGFLLHIGGEKNTSIPVDALLAIIGENEEDITSLLSTSELSSPTSISASSSLTTNEESAINSFSKKLSDGVVIMPRLSDTMEMGKIIKWYKKIGDEIKKGDLLAEIETDKATMDLESFVQGTLLHVAAKDGDSLAVNQMLCIIGEKGIDISNLMAGIAIPTSDKIIPIRTKQPTSSPSSTISASSVERIKASPLAKKIAQENNINLAHLSGSGDNRRVVKRDIEKQMGKAPASQPMPATPSPSKMIDSSLPVMRGDTHTDTPVSQMRSVIARRLLESKQNIPHFYLKTEVLMDEVMRQRTILNEISPVKISFNDIMIKAAAMALRRHPEVNASWMNNMLRYYHYVHVGSAVAIPDGLIVPVIRHADQKGLSEIAQETKSLYQKAKNKQLKPEEFSGGTFTISNLGMMDIDDFSAIINPPESCILAVGKIREVLIKKGEDIFVESRMTLTLSCDHRVVDGAVGAQFLQTIKRCLEVPMTVLL